MQKPVREVLERAFINWAEHCQVMRGDIFATAKDIENIKSDPLAFDRMLQGEDAFKFLDYICRAAEEVEREAQSI